MNFYLINIFHEAASSYCSAILERGFEVCAVGLHQMEDFIVDEEEIWMTFGRNANVSYLLLDEFLQNAPENQQSKMVYFPFQQEREFESKLFERVNEWGQTIYIVAHEEESLERKENYIFLSDNCQQFIQEFLPK